MPPWKQNGTEEQRGAVVPALPALTAPVAAGANPTKAEFDALRTDVVNLRAALVNLTSNLRDTNIVD